MNIFQATADHSQMLAFLDNTRPFSAHWTLMDWQEELAQVTSCVWCAEENGEIIGFIALRGAAGQYEILNLAVAASHARLGIGRRLIRQACMFLTQRGAQQISLEVSAANLPAQGLYLNTGFKRVGVRKQFYADGSDGLIMEKKL